METFPCGVFFTTPCMLLSNYVYNDSFRKEKDMILQIVTITIASLGVLFTLGHFVFRAGFWFGGASEKLKHIDKSSQ